VKRSRLTRLLYDLETDRTERRDLAGEHPDALARMIDVWQAWATRIGVATRRDLEEILESSPR